MQVAGEAGDDDPPSGSHGEDALEGHAHRGLRRREARLLGIGRVGEQQADALGLRQLADAGEVGAPTVHRREVDLEVSGVQHHALRGVDGDGHRRRH